MDDVIDDEKYEVLLQEARRELARFVTPKGAIAFATPAHIVSASKSDNNQI